MLFTSHLVISKLLDLILRYHALIRIESTRCSLEGRGLKRLPIKI
uniref:Uncharacterized protein n=1 Tax=Arundo donax TaxID=35708 RepID=A0A0A9BK93_ARUDO